MNIHHRSMLNTEKVIEYYSRKDGVDIKYVCTSAVGAEAQAMDIFYRKTPHPEFGNRYFGLYWHRPHPELRSNLMITNADEIENTEFEMIEVNGQWHYSQHRHDFHTVGDVSIDGGRAYTRLSGNLSKPKKVFVVKNGIYEEKEKYNDE